MLSHCVCNPFLISNTFLSPSHTGCGFVWCHCDGQELPFQMVMQRPRLILFHPVAPLSPQGAFKVIVLVCVGQIERKRAWRF